tara:strand:- start:1295 stop:1930 length:636 start_codon:yes stop_codon:yes gene_type:complete
MQTGRKTSNGLLGGLAFFSGPFKWVATWLGWATDVNDAIALFTSQHFAVDWQAVGNLAFFLSVGLLIALNWDKASSYYQRRQRENKRNWDRPVAWVIRTWLPSLSVVAYGADGNKVAAAAIEAFMSEARSGRIDVAGRAPGSLYIQKIKPRELVQLSLQPDSIKDDKTGTGGRFVYKDNDVETVRFEGLLVDSGQIEKVWPRGKLDSWMGD